jgi:hypothetical protein
MEVSDQLHAQAALHHRERAPGIHWVGGWVNPRAGLGSSIIPILFWFYKELIYLLSYKTLCKIRTIESDLQDLKSV